ncbi:hypothetical protein DRP07_02260 [Archaeoglobales archaeon]|nr:MAG: hypothetical protein DRP07_02260 [Archaeoglobales archaeon]
MSLFDLNGGANPPPSFFKPVEGIKMESELKYKAIEYICSGDYELAIDVLKELLGELPEAEVV